MADILATLRWLLALELVGLAGLPLARRLFAHLPDRGHAFARPLALLLGCYVLWLLGIIGLLRVDATSFLFGLALVFGLGWALGGRLDTTREERRAVVQVELVFLASFLFGVVLRAYNPDIAATEKPMEFGFLNSILRDGNLPPHDPWLAGYAISYYYFGYVMVGALAKLSGVAAAQAFNLGIATLFALTVTGAFGLVRNLVAEHSQRELSSSVPTFFGALAGVSLSVMGNLEGFLEVLHARRLLPMSFWRWLDILDLSEPIEAVSWLPQRNWWWWRASRVITDRSPAGAHMETIDEFPGFSFLLGDMHPHVLALPFVLLAIAVSVEWALRLREEPRARSHGRFLVLAAVTMGGLGFLNTWDWPAYVVLFGVATWLALPEMAVRARLWQAVRLAALVAAAGFLAYLPFYLFFQSQAAGIAPTLFVHTKLRQFTVMFGPFLFVAVFFAGRALLSQRPLPLRRGLLWWLLLFLTPFAFLSLISLGLLALPSGREVLAQLRGMAEVREIVGDRPWSQVIASLLVAKVSAPWMLLVVTGVMAAAIAVIEGPLPRPLPETRGGETGEHDGSPLPSSVIGADTVVCPVASFPRFGKGDAPKRSDALASGGLGESLSLAMIAIGLALTWAVEFIYLRDYFGTRMNTVFKFYYQAWVLLAIGCSFGAYHLWQGLCGWRRLALVLPAALLFVLGLLYPLLAAYAKTDGFRGPPTLDGTLYLRASAPADYAAIRWLNENVRGTPVILEAAGGSYSAFARISANTGLPTLIGWDFHEMQWRGSGRFQGRQEEVRLVYTSPAWAEVQAVLLRYDVHYVYVGPLELQTYGPRAGELLGGRLPLAFEATVGGQTARIYEVRQ